jgi:2-dehydro-3-deoxyphosphogluconate aldolase/(4S)-4-hydroxy-2-oxoglutarate aldolase
MVGYYRLCFSLPNPPFQSFHPIHPDSDKRQKPTATIMTERTFSWERFAQMPVVGIVRGLPMAVVQKLLPVYAEAGLTNIEITMNTEGAAEMIRYAVERHGEQLNVGAGTVCTLPDLAEALEAGAQYIVTPVVEEQVIAACVQQQVPVFPGALTPTEIFRAWKLGAAMVKVFPATSFGPEYIKDVKAPLNNVKLLPTGGVSLENLTAFLRAGADGVGMGSQLLDKKLIQQQDWEGLRAHFAEFVQKVRAHRKE